MQGSNIHLANLQIDQGRSLLRVDHKDARDTSPKRRSVSPDRPTAPGSLPRRRWPGRPTHAVHQRWMRLTPSWPSDYSLAKELLFLRRPSEEVRRRNFVNGRVTTG